MFFVDNFDTRCLEFDSMSNFFFLLVYIEIGCGFRLILVIKSSLIDVGLACVFLSFY